MAVKELERGKKYKIIVVVSYDGDKRKTHCETFYGGKKDAYLRESEIKKEVKIGTYICNDKMTMEELANEWLKQKKDVVERKTFRNYTNYAKNITQYLGRIKVKDVTLYVLQDFYKRLKNDTNFSSKTIFHHYTALSNMFSFAEKWGLIIRNPHKLVERPKVEKKEVECYSPEETEQLLIALRKEPLKTQAVILFALDTGCRRGEITGLTWKDIDFEINKVSINKTTQYVTGYGIFEKGTKNESSNREIFFSNVTSDILQKYKKEQIEKQLQFGSKWGNSERVFTTNDGNDMHPNTPSWLFKRVIEKNNLKRIKFHALRHTSISLQILNGVQVQIISKRAGHSNVTTTHKIYSHFFEEGYKEVADKMDGILRIK